MITELCDYYEKWGTLINHKIQCLKKLDKQDNLYEEQKLRPQANDAESSFGGSINDRAEYTNRVQD